MGNTLLTINMITREILMILSNNLTFTNRVDKSYDNKFAQSGAKIGETLSIRLPVQWTNTQGQGIVLQDVTETSVPLTLNTQYQRSFQFSSVDRTLSIDDFAKRFLKTAIISMANQIDFDGLAQYKNVYQIVGTPGTVPTALLTYINAGVALDNASAPVDDDRSLCLNPLMQGTIVDNLKGLFQSSSEISSQYKRGRMGTTVGFDWYMDQNVNVHTVGPLGGTPLVNAVTTANGATSLVTDGWTASAASRLKRGDVFTIANVNMTNIQNKQSVGSAQQFVVTADISSDSGGNLTIPISPAITYSGAYQNVDAMPANNAALTIIGAASTVSPQGLGFHKQAFTFANVDLVMPEGVDMASRMSDPDLGLSVRVVRAYDINTDRFPCRCDLLGGWATLRPALAVRIAS